LASSLFGLLWFYGGSAIAFITSAVAAVITTVYIVIYFSVNKI